MVVYSGGIWSVTDRWRFLGVNDGWNRIDSEWLGRMQGGRGCRDGVFEVNIDVGSSDGVGDDWSGMMCFDFDDN